MSRSTMSGAKEFFTRSLSSCPYGLTGGICLSYLVFQMLVSTTSGIVLALRASKANKEANAAEATYLGIIAAIQFIFLLVSVIAAVRVWKSSRGPASVNPNLQDIYY
eukprot:tig00000681_g3085.t1